MFATCGVLRPGACLPSLPAPHSASRCCCAAPPPSLPQAGPNGLRIADLLDTINAQSSVRVSERDLRLALNELVGGSRDKGEGWLGWPEGRGGQWRAPACIAASNVPALSR